MRGTTDIHPDAVLESLLTKGGRSNRQINLKKIHEICRIQYEAGLHDFSLPTIGRLVEKADIIKGRVLYNAQSADYKNLIAAWGAYVGPPPPKPVKSLASHDYLLRIEDPAIRSIMQAIISERDKLKAQINVLKANTQVTVDMRPLITRVSDTPRTEYATNVELTVSLTQSEREALRKAVSAEYLEEQGLHEGSHGEIINNRGRIVFDVGFARAIRKVLEME